MRTIFLDTRYTIGRQTETRRVGLGLVPEDAQGLCRCLIRFLIANPLPVRRLCRLEEALKEDITKSSIIVDGTIQRFEFTFELAWKLLRLMLLNEGIESNTPRAVLKEAYLAKLIGDGEGWIDMLEDRNKASHLYDEKIAAAIYRKIKETHFQRLSDLRLVAEKVIRARP